MPLRFRQILLSGFMLHLLGGAAFAQSTAWQQKVQQGHQAMTQGNYRQALNLLDQALEANPNAWEAYLKRAEVYRQLGNHAAVLRNYNEVTALNPRQERVWLERYRYFMGRNMVAQAEYDLTEGLRLLPYSPELNYAYASHLLKQGQTQAAMEALETIKQVQPMTVGTTPIQPVFVKASALRAQLYARQQAMMPYGQELNFLIATQPRVAKLYWNRAIWAKNYLQDLTMAKSDLNSYLYLSPRDGMAYAMRGELNLAGNLCKDALDDLRMACKLGYRSACYKKAPCALPKAPETGAPTGAAANTATPAANNSPAPATQNAAAAANTSPSPEKP